MHAKIVGLIGGGILFSATDVSAEPYKGVAFAGGTVGDGVSGYAGAIHALPKYQLGRGLAFRASLSGGNYAYGSDHVKIEGKFVAAEAALIYQLSGGWGWANFSAGPRVSDLSLSPRDPANERQGTRVDLAVQSDGAFQVGHAWRLSWIGSLGVREGAYLSRVDLGRVVERRSQTRVGIEAGLQGDPSYQTATVGLFASTKLSTDLEGRISVGTRDQKNRDPRPYGMIGLSLLY